ncbi:MAG: hypothetical protein IPH12_10675 [Saprospirales bacterium]|nr:hypothetical protein [Saprospirales bacterium]
MAEGYAGAGDAANQFFIPAPPTAEELLKTARQSYRAEQVWRFTQLRPGEKRNLFVTLQGTANMLKDTSAFIHLQGLFTPFDPAVPPEEYTLEIEIVSSHDPNLIAVSDSRVNYRHLGKQKLDYQVRFQNNGEGPATTVELTISLPKGLSIGKMRPLEWYPECPICADPPQPGSCLDTATTKDSLVFTFRNIYLPGSHQEGVADYDSTKGFVRYRIETRKDMPKRAFSSQASIVFDKNKPVRTNFSKTRFKPGISPGLKAGYAFPPDSAGNGYMFLGASLSPYKSWRLYPQLELLTGVKGAADIPETSHADTFTYMPVPGQNLVVDSIVQVLQTGSRGFVSFEIPLLLRKNFTRFFGAGIGAGARIILHNGEDVLQVNRSLRRRRIDPPVVVGTEILPGLTETVNYRKTETLFSVFADLTLGSVRVGPNIGLRAGGYFQEDFHPFVQVSVEWKF